ncbi:MAG: hypothetical protein DCC58_06085 [Chloroflexi bacterium]|nr:MAG: hypothetical protein DCC58_06085 [Chloroflexota bacterium]
MMERFERGSLALVNGTLFTGGRACPHASALGIWNGTIAYVGDDAEAARAAAGPGAETIDLGGRTTTAGLIDAHMHPLLYGEFLEGIDLTQVRSISDVLAEVRSRAAAMPTDAVISGWGYYPVTIAEGRMPTLDELETVAPQHAVVLVHRSGHEATVNRRTLQRIGVDRNTTDPVGGYFERDATGELTGKLVENAMGPLGVFAAPPGPEVLDRRLRRVTEALLAYGITSAGEANLSSAAVMQAYQRSQSNANQPRVRFHLMLDHWSMLEPVEHIGLAGRFGDRWLRANTIKFFIDGTEGQRTAKLSQPFADDPGNTGMWMFPPEQFKERVLRAHAAGWQCAVHAIGDAAVELTLDTFQAAQAALPRADARHRVEHASLLRPDLVERFAREGAVPVPGARFASNDYPVLIERFGPERLRWYQPWNALLERNVPVAVSSDAPVQSPDPLKNLWAIVNSRSEFERDLVMQPEERISLQETLLAYTVNGAYAFHAEQSKGMLRAGMLGDVTVFDRDLSRLDPLELDTASVALTVVDGCVAYRTI